MSPDDARHGTYAGAIAHWLEDDERPCGDCARAEWRYRKTRQMRHLRGDLPMSPSIGIVRRIQALHALGWTGPKIAQEAGISVNSMRSIDYHGSAKVRTTTAIKIIAAYDRLSMTRPEGRYANRARVIARSRGWLPPLAWDDIDRDPEPPPVESAGNWEDQIDAAVVHRVLNGGDRPRNLTRAEAAEIVRVLLGRGMSTHQIERDYGINTSRYRQKVSAA